MRTAIILLIIVFSCYYQQDETGFRQQRKTMVDVQLKGRDITDKSVLDAMRNVPRHLFVPEDIRAMAYNDQPLPIGEGQTISQPYIVAYMTQVLKLKETDRVLEIGTGSGYQAAVLAEIVDSVYTIEIVKSLGEAARTRLKEMDYNNVSVKVGDGYNGWPEKAPFDAIMVTAGAEYIPQPLIDQLAEEGRMVIPVGPHNGTRDLLLLTRKKGKIKKKSLMPVLFVPFTREKN